MVKSEFVGREMNASNKGSKFYTFIKSQGIGILTTLISTTFSATVIAYVLSKIFIKSYLNEISFDGLVYDAFVETATISPFFFSILTVVLVFILTFLVIPAFLRYLYHDSIKSGSKPEGFMKVLIEGLFTYSLVLPSIIILISFIFDFFIKELLTLYFVLPALAYIFIIYSSRQIMNVGLFIKLIFNLILFSCLLILLLYPLLVLNKAVSHSLVKDTLALIILSVLWIGFTFLAGFRLTDNKPVQYFIDFSIAFLIFLEILILSPNTLLVSISNYAGVADKEAKFYKVRDSEFEVLEKNIELLWFPKATKTCSQLLNEELNFSHIKQSCYFEFQHDGSTYFTSKIIYRSGSKVVLCPPNYVLGKDMNYLCFVADSNTIEATAFTTEFLLNHDRLNKNFTSRSLNY